MTKEELYEFADDAFREAQHESDPGKAKNLMAQSKTAQDMARAIEKADAEKQAGFFTQQRTFTWREVLLGIATPLATVAAALIAVAGQKSQSRAMAAAEKEKTIAKKEMLALICKAQENDIVDTSSVKALNELNKL